MSYKNKSVQTTTFIQKILHSMFSYTVPNFQRLVKNFSLMKLERKYPILMQLKNKKLILVMEN